MKSKLIILITFSAQFAVAQEMKMDKNHHMISSSKNIYLQMMDTMMAKMESAPIRCLPDLDFVSLMIPHHEGAIEMAEYEISHGKNKETIQLSKSILVEQTNDIQVMKLLISQLTDSAKEADKSFENEMIQSMTVMMKNMPSNDKLTNADTAFAMVMIPHHQAAIDMAAALIKHSGNAQVSTFAMQLLSEEEVEIEQMSAFIK
jgi:uncharacterized protein (DUF305 family)